MSCPPQVLQEAPEHLPGLHPRDRVHVQPVRLPGAAGLLQVDGLRRVQLQGRAQPAYPLHQHVSVQLQRPHQQASVPGTGDPPPPPPPPPLTCPLPSFSLCVHSRPSLVLTCLSVSLELTCMFFFVELTCLSVCLL